MRKGSNIKQWCDEKANAVKNFPPFMASKVQVVGWSQKFRKEREVAS